MVYFLAVYKVFHFSIDASVHNSIYVCGVIIEVEIFEYKSLSREGNILIFCKH